MAITSLDTLLQGMMASPRLTLNKTSLASQVLGHEASLWRATGFPAQGAIPTSASVCNASTVGSIPLAPRAAGQDRLLSQITAQMATIGHCLVIEDRLMHMGGLDGTSVFEQTVNLNLHANLGASNLAERIGSSDYSEVEWYMEWYIATGATVSTPSCNVTFSDGTTGTAQVYVLGATALPASVAAARRYKIYATNGKSIRSIESVTLSASTGVAGNFGITAVRKLADCTCYIANIAQVFDWSYLGTPKIADNACLSLGMVCATTSTGAVAVTLKQAVA